VTCITCLPVRATYLHHVKALSHWLLASFLAMNLTWGHDWVHLPQLVHHYQEHRAEQEGLSFLDFLAMHYAERDHQHNDRSHEDLPFKTHQHGPGIDHGNLKQTVSDPLRAVSFPELSGERDHPLPRQDDPLMGHLAELLRPPRPLA